MRSPGLRSSAWPTRLSVCCRSSNAGSSPGPISAARHARPRPKRPISRGGNGHDTLVRRHLRPRLVRAAGDQQHHRQPDRGTGGPPRAGRSDGLALMPEGRFTDEGYSGATLVRPALERLRDAVAAGTLDRLYVHSPDRLARRYAYQVLLIDEFHRAGVEIIFLNRPIGLSPEDDLLLQVQGMVAEYERAKILERSRRGKRHAARQGAVSVLSGAPYGYRYVGKRDGGGVARYEILEDEARIVRRIFAWIGRERVSIGETCRRLQQEGIRTRSGKPAWDRSTVWGILRNPAYAGTAAFGKTRIGPMPARLRPVRG